MLSETVLLVMCDETLAKIYGRKFEADGWDVEVAEDFEEAKRRMMKFRPSIIVLETDCVADVDGAIKELRSMPTLLRTKLAVMAHAAEKEAIDSAHKAGAHTYILSPHSTPLEVVKKMKRLLLT